MKISFTPTGRLQFLAAIEFIKADNPDAANQFRLKAENVLRRLQQFPDSGRRLPEFPDINYREVIVAPYRIFYRIEEGTVWIVAVWHSAQIPEIPSP